MLVALEGIVKTSPSPEQTDRAKMILAKPAHHDAHSSPPVSCGRGFGADRLGRGKESTEAVGQRSQRALLSEECRPPWNEWSER